MRIIKQKHILYVFKLKQEAYSKKMKAVVLKDFGGVENLVIEEVRKPEVKADEVLIRVKAIGINQIDLKTRKGGGIAAKLKEENPMILGWDVAGEITEAGSEVKEFKAGDVVFGTVNFPGCGNAYAEYVAAPASQLAMKPENISFEEAAGACQSPLTAWQAIIDTGHVKKGDRVLIHGAAGGVGSYAVQIAKHLGAYVIGTASGEDRDFVLNLGADECIDYKTQKFEERVKDLDFIMDSIGGDNFVRSLTVLKPEGTIVLLPSDKKDEADKVAKEKNVRNFHHILMHSSGDGMKGIAAMLTDGSMRSSVSKTFPFEKMREAHEEVATGKHTGKVAVVL